MPEAHLGRLHAGRPDQRECGPPDLRGYARTGVSVADPWKDNPFYGSLQIQGAVGWDVDYFKLQVSKNGAPWADLPSPAFGGFTRSYWDGSTFVPVAFTPAPKNGHLVIITRRHYEALNPGIPRFGGQVIWNDYATLCYFDTTQPGLTPRRAVPAAVRRLHRRCRGQPDCGQRARPADLRRGIGHRARVPAH